MLGHNNEKRELYYMWLLLDSVFTKLRAAAKQGREATKEQALELTAFAGWSVDDIYSVSGKAGVIEIAGVITKEADPFAAVFGGANTTYPAIIEAVALAEADPSVETIVLNIDSPGGQFNGMLDAMDAIRLASKPTVAQVAGLATSAAYGLAASADSIEALSKTASFGSIGVAVDLYTSEREISLTNTGSPNKRPDPTTHQGQAVIRSELDAAFELFAAGIAAKRGINARNVAEQYGRGGTFFAEQAKKMGMIDKLTFNTQNEPLTQAPSPTSAPFAKSNTLNNNEPEGKNMDLAELKEKHPEVYAQAVAEGIATPAPVASASSDSDGEDLVAKERSRVNAHLHMGQESGDMETAHQAIASGAEMTPELTAKYVMAASKKAAIDLRSADNDDADAGDLGTSGGDVVAEDKEKAEAVASNILAKASKHLNIA